MKRLMNTLFIALMMVLSSLTYAKPGLLFNIAQSGGSASADVILCLNGKGPLSCQNYHVTAQDLAITSTVNHQYSAAGIKVLTPGYPPTGCTLYPKTGYCLFGLSKSVPTIIHLAPNAQKQNQTITFTSTPPSSPVIGGTYNVVATASSGLTVDITIDSSSSSVCTINGSMVTFNATGSCVVIANQTGNAQYNAAPQEQQTIKIVSFFPVAKGPSNVFAVPGNSQATISWTAPTNTGAGAITSYTVTYGLTSGTTFTAPGCNTDASTCTVSGLTNDEPYTFAVSTVTKKDGLSQTGPASLSGPITPKDGLVVSPSTLALSGLGSGAARTITLTNTTGSNITLDAAPAPGDFNPALPADTTVLTTCTTTTPIANGDSCTITITPGSTVSTNSSNDPCTTGISPQASTLSIGYNSSRSTTANVVVLGYGCQYQGGYLFSIDDSTPTNQSIGGKVVATSNQAAAYPGGIDWSPSGAYDSIWGIDDSSTSTAPSPNASSGQAASFQAGQLNCDAVNDGACATRNIQVFYNSSLVTSYAAGLCRQPLTGASTTACAGGPTCYSDWYLPSACDLGPFGRGGNYSPESDSQSCTNGSANIQQQLVNANIVGISGNYWSSTEYSDLPQFAAWIQYFASSGDYQGGIGKVNDDGVRCVRGLTN